MRQIDLIGTSPQAAPADDDPDAERDLFGNPIKRSGPAAPTYRPRKPVQQGFAFDTFTLKGS
jgi:hypothetical protein